MIKNGDVNHYQLGPFKYEQSPNDLVGTDHQ